MKIEVTEIRWVDQHGACSLHELVEASQLSADELRELVELGVLRPLPAAGPVSAGVEPEPRFAAECLVTVRAVRRLREDFDLDAHGVSVALALMERIAILERQLRALHAQLPDSRR
jgi:chaperone modulatory protein CbpM